jgi:hypothetical protein
VVSVSGVSKKVADDGCYRFSPKFSWHGAVLIGPVSQSLLPHLDAVCLFGAVVDADAAGYCPRHVLLLPGSWPPEYIKFPGGDIIENTDKGNYLEYNIVLQPARKDRNDSITRDRDVQPPAGGD